MTTTEMNIVINTKAGGVGFLLSNDGIREMRRLGSQFDDDQLRYGHVPRHDGRLVETVLKLGLDASGPLSRLTVMHTDTCVLKYEITQDPATRVESIRVLAVKSPPASK